MHFSLTRHQRDDRVVTLAPVGEVDMCAVGALGPAVQDALCTPHRIDVVVDLARVTFLDCAGIGALVPGRNTAVSRGRGYTVVNPQRQVRRVLQLTGVLATPTGRLQSAPWSAEQRGYDDPGATVTTGEWRRHRRHRRPPVCSPLKRIGVGDGEVVVDGARRWTAEPRAQRVEPPGRAHR
jgi:anti-anti-sigma factor